MSLTHPPRYQLPTHLDTPDTIDLPLFGVTVSVTIRQGIISLGGGSLAFQVWEASLGWTRLLSLLHWAMPVLLAFFTYVFATQKVRGRYFEAWTVVLYRYWTLPTVFVWCREHPLASLEAVDDAQDPEASENEEQETI